MVPGVYATVPILSAWMANNSEPYYRRATSVAVGFILSNSVSFYLLQVYSLLPLFTFVHHIRAVFWVRGVSQLMKDQNSGKQQSWTSFCKRPPLLLFCYLLSPYFFNTISTLNSSIVIVVGSFVNVAYLSWRNKVKKRPEERAKLLDKYKGNDDGEGGLDAWMELGDRHPDFVYTLWVFFFYLTNSNTFIYEKNFCMDKGRRCNAASS